VGLLPSHLLVVPQQFQQLLLVLVQRKLSLKQPRPPLVVELVLQNLKRLDWQQPQAQ
jgi:hypothetical protein